MASAANQGLQNLADLEMATHLGIEKNVTYATNTISRNFMPYLIGACDIYAAPSRLEGIWNATGGSRSMRKTGYRY
jgi:glycosyltransferase involved in cell wall biosynthesis